MGTVDMKGARRCTVPGSFPCRATGLAEGRSDDWQRSVPPLSISGCGPVAASMVTEMNLPELSNTSTKVITPTSCVSTGRWGGDLPEQPLVGKFRRGATISVRRETAGRYLLCKVILD